MWVEREADNLHLVTFQSVVHLASVRVPNLSFLIEGARHDFVSEGVVEGHSVDDIGMLIK